MTLIIILLILSTMVLIWFLCNQRKSVTQTHGHIFLIMFFQHIT